MLRSLKHKFMLVQAAGILFSLLMVAGSSYLLLVDSVKSTQSANLRARSEHLASLVEHDLENYREVFQRIETLDYHVNFRDLPLSRHFAKFQFKFPVLSYINSSGGEEVKVVSGKKTEQFAEFAEAAWFQEAMSRPNQIITVGPQLIPELGEPGLQLVMARFDYFGDRFIGLLRGVIPVALLSHELEEQKNDIQDRICLLGRDGRLLYCSADCGKPGVVVMAAKVSPLAGAHGDHSGGVRRDLIHGTDSYVAATVVPSIGWTVAVSMPYADFMAAPLQMKYITLLVALVALMLGLSLIVALSEPLLRHLRQIVHHTQLVSAGELGHRLNIRRGDELQDLADSINQMTESIALEHAGREALDQLLQSIIDPLVVTGEDDRIVKVNQATLELLRVSRVSLLGQPLQSLFGEQETLRTPGGVHELMVSGRIRNHETTVLQENGRPVPVWFSCSRIDSARPEQGGIICIIRDIRERKQAEKEITRLAYYDSLTGLPNRTLLLNRLDQALLQGEREHMARNERLAILLLDLDRFKYVNDSLGHDVGDLLLKEMTARLKGVFRASDTLARLGADEFVVLLPRVKQAEDVAGLARDAMAVCSRAFQVAGQEIFSSLSIGIALYPDDGKGSVSLLKNVDAALHHAKAGGRGCFRFFSREMDQKSRERLRLESRLRNAVGRLEGFSLHYQQRVDLASGRIVGVEALLRWQDDELGAVSPDRFIPVTEETGLILPLGEWVLQTACAQAQSWRAEGLPPVKMAVNLSGCQLKDPGLADLVERILQRTGFDPTCLELELTESMLMESVERNIETMRQLKALGVSLAIDDFGTGYSSLRYLQHFPIDVMKIDRSFVMEIGNGKQDSAIIRATIALAQSLNLRVVGEGVETETQLDFLQSHQCNEVQGYLFSRPVSAGEFRGQLSRQG
ncbi:bifunctional diguanylate cyclase/phosphodiesterase [Trichloromonas sp.]|uniref:bifunctional diguanylate cyclase/phosphodiesterase n=1 Tax=Trichloromonas sp. TaxID=3069249 RepID=UPI003D81982F